MNHPDFIVCSFVGDSIVLKRFNLWSYHFSRKLGLQLNILTGIPYDKNKWVGPAHVLLNLLNELGKRDKMRGLPRILSLCHNEFNKFNNTSKNVRLFLSYDIKTTFTITDHTPTHVTARMRHRTQTDIHTTALHCDMVQLNK